MTVTLSRADSIDAACRRSNIIYGLFSTVCRRSNIICGLSNAICRRSNVICNLSNAACIRLNTFNSFQLRFFNRLCDDSLSTHLCFDLFQLSMWRSTYIPSLLRLLFNHLTDDSFLFSLCTMHGPFTCGPRAGQPRSICGLPDMQLFIFMTTGGTPHERSLAHCLFAVPE